MHGCLDLHVQPPSLLAKGVDQMPAVLDLGHSMHQGRACTSGHTRAVMGQISTHAQPSKSSALSLRFKSCGVLPTNCVLCRAQEPGALSLHFDICMYPANNLCAVQGLHSPGHSRHRGRLCTRGCSAMAAEPAPLRAQSTAAWTGPTMICAKPVRGGRGQGTGRSAWISQVSRAQLWSQGLLELLCTPAEEHSTASLYRGGWCWAVSAQEGGCCRTMGTLLTGVPDRLAHHASLQPPAGTARVVHLAPFKISWRSWPLTGLPSGPDGSGVRVLHPGRRLQQAGIKTGSMPCAA